jgi:hypothetical protein
MNLLRHILILIIGFAYGVFASLVGSFILGGLGGAIGGADIGYLFLVSWLPSGVSFVIITLLRNMKKWIWVFSIVFGYLIVFYSGTYEAINQNHGVNAQEYFKWGPRYALYLLPFTTGIMYFAIKYYWKWINSIRSE